MTANYSITVILTALVVILGSGCDQTKPSDNLTDLEGTDWTVDGIPSRVKASLAFGEDGRVTGFAGCNRFFASYTSDSATLNIKDVGSTRKMCPEVEMSVERELLKTLAIVDQWRGNVRQIELTAPVNQTKIKLARVTNKEP